jgi:hypothetical protein
MENGCKGKSHKRLQLEIYKYAYMKYYIKDRMNTKDEMITCGDLDGCGHIRLHEHEKAPAKASRLLESGNSGGLKKRQRGG